MYGTLIASATVGVGGTTAITFSSIPQTYTDLFLVISGRSTQAVVKSGQYIRFNADDVGSNYSYKSILGNGTTASTSGTSFGFLGNGVGGSAATNVFGNTFIYVPNYTSTANKLWSSDLVGESSQQDTEIRAVSGWWTTTAAINSISLNFNNQSATTAQYSTAYLYGILKGSGGATVA